MKIRVWLFLPLLACIGSSLAFPSEIMIPASQVQKGGASFALYWTRSDQDLNLQVNSTDKITVNGNSIFSQVTNEFACKGTANSLIAKLECNPFDGFYYWLKAGSGSYDLEIPSLPAANRLSGQDFGSVAGFGMRSQLFPDTIVTPAVAIELGGTYAAYNLNLLKSGDLADQRVSDKFELFEAQMSCIISKKLGKFEPYGGLKVFSGLSQLTDTSSGTRVSGTKDGAGIFAGTRLYVHPKESFVVEASFVGETTISAGWNLDF